MATTVARLEAVLTANTRDFDRAMGRSEGRMKKVGRAAGLAGVAVATGLAVGLEKSIHAAIRAEVVDARLGVAFKTAGLNAAAFHKQVERLEASSRKLGFTDEQTKDSLGSLIVATHNMRKASKDLSVAQDIARFRHVDLTSATKMLTMAMTGSQRAAKQLGISVQPVTTAEDALRKTHEDLTTAIGKADLAHAKFIDKQRTGQAVIDAVTAKVHGQADAFSKTAAGGMEQFRAQLEHIEVAIGQKLLPIMTRAIQYVINNWPQISATIQKAWAQIKPTLVALGDLIVSVVAIIRNHWNTIGPIVYAVVRVVRDQLAIITGIIKLFSAILRGDWSEAWNQLRGIMTNALRLVRDDLMLWKGIFVAVATGIGHAVVRVFENLPGQIGGAIAGGMGELKAKLQEIFDWHKIVGWIKDALGFGSPSPHFMAIGHDMVDSMARGVGAASGVLKDAVVNLAKKFTPHIPSIDPGGVSGALGPLPGEHASGSAEHYLVPWAHREGIAVTSVAGGKHVAGSYHYQHRAIDVAGSAAKMRQFFSDTANHFGIGNITEMFYDPIGYYIKNGNIQRGAIGGHSDHVHVALAEGGLVTQKTRALIGEAGPEAVIPIKGNSWQERYRNFMYDAWRIAGPLFPNATRSMPPVYFEKPGEDLFVGTDMTPNRHGALPRAGTRTLFWPRWMNFFDKNQARAQSAMLTLIHEWAHEFQSRPTVKNYRLSEGGAEAFAERFAPGIFHQMGLPYKYRHMYEQVTNWVRRNKGWDWITRGQFGNYDSGGWLKPGLTLAYNGTGRPERVSPSQGGDVIIPVSVGGEQIATIVFDMLRRKAKVFENRNGRLAFGGA